VGDREDDQDNAQLQPVASSTDVTVRDAAKHASVPLRRIRAGEVRCEEFLYELVRHEAPFDRVGWKAHLWAVAAAR
jgi:hypothetical protein